VQAAQKRCALGLRVLVALTDDLELARQAVHSPGFDLQMCGRDEAARLHGIPGQLEIAVFLGLVDLANVSRTLLVSKLSGIEQQIARGGDEAGVEVAGC